MGELADEFREWRQHKREMRDRHTVECPGCPPNRNPTKLFEGQTCLVCGYQRPKEESLKREMPRTPATHPHQCPRCSRRFLRQRDLEQHTEMKHGQA